MWIARLHGFYDWRGYVPASFATDSTTKIRSDMAQTIVPVALGTITIFLTMTSAALLFLLAVSPSATHGSPFGLVLASAITEVVLCVSWAILVVRCRLLVTSFAQVYRKKGLLRQMMLLSICALVLSLAAAAVVGSAIGQLARIQSVTIAGRSVTRFPTITVVIWSTSVLAQGAFVVSIVLALKLKTTAKAPQHRFAVDEPLREMKVINPTTAGANIQPNSFQEISSSTPRSLSESDADSSLRSSFSTVQRPGSSRRALLNRQHSQPRKSARSSSDGPSGRPSQDEGFDAWDTSGVSSQMRETVLLSNPPGNGTGLPTIPGSRSPSPAKALEGPFFNPSPDDSPPQSPLPQPPVSCQASPPSSPLQPPNLAAPFPAAIGTPPSSPLPTNPTQSQGSSRTLSPAKAQLGEDHIHPLFRTSSPTPPPSASSNTIVTAAPEAGRSITQRTFHRIRSGSLPNTSSPLLHSESSPEIGNASIPVSLVSVIPSPEISLRPEAFHQRKRSASFETTIIRN